MHPQGAPKSPVPPSRLGRQHAVPAERRNSDARDRNLILIFHNEPRFLIPPST